MKLFQKTLPKLLLWCIPFVVIANAQAIDLAEGTLTSIDKAEGEHTPNAPS